MGHLDLTIEGMTCPHCARRVESALRRVVVVAKATVNLASQTAVVDFDAARVPVRALTDAVREEGYVLGSTRVRMGVGGPRCASWI